VIFSSTQNPHYDHKEVVQLLALDEAKVRLVQAATGGGFGSKLDLGTAGFVGLALHYLQRPVRLVYSREESFLATAKRHPLTIHMKTGADPDGRVRAMKARVICDTGAYGSYGIAVASRAAVHATGPYEITNVDVEVQCVYTNRPFCGAMRGFGAPQMAFAHESQMDVLAEELEIDPLEIRRINALQTGSETATGQLLRASVGIQTCLDAVRPHYERAREHRMKSDSRDGIARGVGVGAMWYGIGNTGVQNPSSARIEIALSGNITLFTGCADIGQGSSTVLAQIAGETLGIPPDTLLLVVADTHATTSAGATSASRQTYISGNAVKDAASKLADVLLTEAVDVLQVPKERLVLDSYFAMDATDPARRVPFQKLVRRAHDKGVPLSWQGYFDPETRPLDPETGQGVPYATYAFACHVAVVAVDQGTGEVSVEKIIAAHDVGKAIHPQNIEGQIQGGVAMGIGFALSEEFIPEKTSSLGEYHMPTSMDVPEIVPILIEDPEPTGPFGAKGVGEPALIPTAPAIINALRQALGKRIYQLPANPERIWKTMQ
jgi:CO/xanthine dehydrogenase Mo-binding subunit